MCVLQFSYQLYCQPRVCAVHLYVAAMVGNIIHPTNTAHHRAHKLQQPSHQIRNIHVTCHQPKLSHNTSYDYEDTNNRFGKNRKSIFVMTHSMILKLLELFFFQLLITFTVISCTVINNQG